MNKKLKCVKKENNKKQIKSLRICPVALIFSIFGGVAD